MESQSVEYLIPVIQTAIGPVILISGLGLLLLTMTNRLGRIIDRSRSLSGELDLLDSAAAQERIALEIDILWSRARSIRMAIIFASLSCAGPSSSRVVSLYLKYALPYCFPVIFSARCQPYAERFEDRTGRA